jgi:tetratricopeptide (TPR) repeat protein
VKVPKQSLCVIALGLIFFAGCGKPKTAQDFFNQAQKELDNHDWNGAIADFTRFIQLKPENFAAYANRATAEFKLGKFNEAILDYNHALELNPKNENLKLEVQAMVQAAKEKSQNKTP